jgi:hypothetical protein
LSAQLFIDIQEGFEDDTVTIKINGKEVYKKNHIKTSLRKGPTDTYNQPVQEGPVTVEVSIPTKNLQDKITITAKDKTYLGISITNDPNQRKKIRFITLPEPFGYF